MDLEMDSGVEDGKMEEWNNGRGSRKVPLGGLTPASN